MPSTQKQKPNLSKELRNSAIILITLGLLHFILSDFLDFTFGFILIAIGIITFFYRSRKMLLVFGILLILIGILNILAVVISSMSYDVGLSYFWLIFGCFQIYIGIMQINRFKKTKENPEYVVKKKRSKKNKKIE